MSIAVPNPRVQAIADGLRALWAPGDVRELRILNTSKKTVSGYFDDVDAMAQAAAAWSGKAPGVYATVNPVEPALLARAHNRVEPYARTTTSDADIARRAWLPIDCDASRPAGISSTEEEHEAALERARILCRWLIELGVPRDSILYGDSGNGAHVLVRIDLPNDQAATDLVRRCLEALSARYDDGAVHIDVSMFNASRIWKTPGTLACKGDNVPDRPHRLAGWRQVPAEMQVCPTRVLERLAGLAPPPAPGRAGHSEFSIEDFIARNLAGRAHAAEPWQGTGRRWRLSECLFNPDHTESAALLQAPSGVLAYRCHHNTCLGKTWEDVRALLEPKKIRADLAPVREPIPLRNGNGAHPPTPQVTGGDGDSRSPNPLELTDMGNAQRFIRRHGQDVLYCDPQEAFHIWDGARWRRDDRQERVKRAMDTAGAIWQEVDSESSQARQSDLIKHAIRSQSAERISAMIRLAQPQIAIRPEEFDTDPYLLNFPNGTMDLRSCAFREHRREDRITKRVKAPYDPSATCPQFEAFISEIMAESAEMIGYMRRFFGYCLTGLNTERMLAFWFGLGANGKSVLSETIQEVLEDFSTVTQSETLMRRERKDLSNDVAALVGSRMVVANETEDGSRIAESLVKQLTGGDMISARHLYADFFTFRPTFKLVIIGNYMPVIRGSDPAIWERIHLIPFSVTIPAEKRDRKLRDKLVTEASGILNWMIEGWRDLQRIGGLAPPADVINATKEYRDDMDILGHFFMDQCVQSPRALTPAHDLYHAYCQWCESATERPVSQTRFGTTLKQRGFRKEREAGGERRTQWRGIGLKAAVPTPADTPDTVDTVSADSLQQNALRDFPENYVNPVDCVGFKEEERKKEEKKRETGGQLF